ncbi:hypothetical protein [Methanosphaerula palustris]|uniref:hypothetical protein n=1 Tax=Methanosphaerula palustris TaxID=475088 RepID=UPI00018486AF|nr:hypothetical protein [Methanosphaerula palustris]
MKRSRSFLLICSLLIPVIGSTVMVSAGELPAASATNTGGHPIMHPNQTTLQRWIEQYDATELVQIDPVIRNQAIQSTGAQ